MREFKFQRILVNNQDLQSLSVRMSEVFRQAFGNGIVVMRRQTWHWLREQLQTVVPKNTFPSTRFVVVNERDGRDVVYDKFYDGRIGVTHSEYNLMLPEIQERAFGPEWAADGPQQRVIFIEGDSHETNFRNSMEDYVYSKVQIESIYSVTTRGYIGLNGDVICPIPEDFKHFQDKTKGHVLVMGFKTWASIPNKTKFILGNGDPSKIRHVAILTNRGVDLDLTNDWELSKEAQQYMVFIREPDAEDLVDAVQTMFNKNIFDTRKLIICGGAAIYAKYASIVQTIHETLVITTKEGDVKLPVNVKEGFEYLPGDPTFFTSKNMEVYRFMTWVRTP